MIVIVCDVCGNSPATIVGLMNDGYALIQQTVKINGEGCDITIKTDSIDLCKDHLPLEGAYQPENCTVVFRWPDHQAPLLSVGVPPPTRSFGYIVEEDKK